MNFLIVDDDCQICDGTARRIRTMQSPEIGEVETAYSGQEALDKLRTGSFQVLFTDIRMDDMDGLQLVEQAKKLQPQLVCVIITAFDQFLYAQRAIRLGVHDFLVKPCSERVMREQALGAARQAQILQAQRMVALEDKASEEVTLPPDSAVKDDNAQLIEQAKAYAREHLHDEIDMATVANQMNLSYSYFSRVFHESTGETFSRFLLETRMEEACRLMKQGERLSDIAIRLGYQNASNLTRSFTREYGMSPSQWLKEQQGKAKR